MRGKDNSIRTTKKTSGRRLSKVRIISGAWRSRQLPIPDIKELRPTPSGVRETLFNWINQAVIGMTCADLFCGSGCLGLEALSRGAKSAVFVDKSRIVTKQMKVNLETLKAKNARVIEQETINFLTTATPQFFDIVFLDPPFRKNWWAQLLPLLEKSWLADHSLVYIEMEKETTLPKLTSWILLKERAAGQLIYRLFEVSKTNYSFKREKN